MQNTPEGSCVFFNNNKKQPSHFKIICKVNLAVTEVLQPASAHSLYNFAIFWNVKSLR